MQVYFAVIPLFAKRAAGEKFHCLKPFLIRRESFAISHSSFCNSLGTLSEDNCNNSK